MKIFVTGASGRIGSAVMKLGRQRGHEMTGLDMNGAPDLGVVEGSIENAALVQEASRGCETIVHAASLHNAALGSETDLAFYRTNVLGSANVFQAALENSIRRFVFCSSLTVQCGNDWSASGYGKLAGETPMNLMTVYETTKCMVEQMGHYNYNAHGIRFCALRYCAVLWSCTRPEEISQPVNLLSRDITVEDSAEATLLACEAEEVYDDVLLIAQDSPFASGDLVRAAYHQDSVLEGYRPDCLQLLKNAGFSTKGRIWPLTDITRAKQVLGWRPTHDFDWFLDQVRGGLRASPVR
jgi:UDP-glucose 4-epimerase